MLKLGGEKTVWYAANETRPKVALSESVLGEWDE